MWDITKQRAAVEVKAQAGSPVLTRADSARLRILFSTWWLPVIISSLWMILPVAIHRNSPRTLLSFHGLLHAAIAQMYLAPGTVGLTPENPFYAGEPVAYYWFFHFLAAQITKVIGWNIFYSFEFLVVLATGALTLTALLLGDRVNQNRASGLLIGFLIMAGTNPLGWVFATRSILLGGKEVLRDSPDHLWGVVHPIYSLIRYNDFGGIYGPLLNFFVNITSRPVALAGLLGIVFFLFRFVRNQRVSSAIGLATNSAITTLFSPIVGITAGGAIGAALLFFGLKDRNRHDVDGKTNMRAAMLGALAIAAGSIVTLPTYYHLLIGPGGGGARFILFSRTGLQQLLGIALSISLLLGLSVIGLYRAQNDRRRFLKILMAAAALLLCTNVAFVLAAGNESNLFHAAVVLLAVPASASVLRRNLMGGTVINRRLAIGIVAVCLPTTLFLIASYINRPDLPVSFAAREIVRTPSSSDEALLYAWIKNNTDSRAVFIIDPNKRVAPCGNTAEFPAMTGRSMFTEDLDHYMSKPYRDSKTRFDLAVRLVSGARLQQSDAEYLSRLNRPLYILKYQSEDPGLLPQMEQNYGKSVFQSGPVAVFELTPTVRNSSVAATNEFKKQ